MSLANVVLDIALEMETEMVGPEWKGYPLLVGAVMGWAKQLRRAVQAAEPPANQVNPGQALILGSAENAPQVGAMSARRIQEAANLEDSQGDYQAMCVGGGEDGCFTVVERGMPVGASIEIGGEVYQLHDDRKLHFAGKKGNFG